MCSIPPHKQLFVAIDNNNIDKVKKILLKNNVDLLYKNPNQDNETCLHRAVRIKNSTTCLELLLNANEELLQLESKDGKSPFLLACSLGHYQSVEFIINKYIDNLEKLESIFYHVDDSRSNALHYAS